MTDREKIEDIAKFFGTFKRRTKRSSYIGERRFVFDRDDELSLVMEQSVRGLWVTVGRAADE